jgi:hypothetical protein
MGFIFYKEVFEQVPEEYKRIVRECCKLIENQQIIQFPYTSKDGNNGIRTVAPYIVGFNQKNNLVLIAQPIDTLFDGNTGHYLIEQLSKVNIKKLSQSYSEPRVDRKRITETPNLLVISRYQYPDEID